METTNGVRWRMFAACRDGDCGDCAAEMLVLARRDCEPAMGAPVVVERCGCDCHASAESLPSGGAR